MLSIVNSILMYSFEKIPQFQILAGNLASAGAGWVWGGQRVVVDVGRASLTLVPIGSRGCSMRITLAWWAIPLCIQQTELFARWHGSLRSFLVNRIRAAYCWLSGITYTPHCTRTMLAPQFGPRHECYLRFFPPLNRGADEAGMVMERIRPSLKWH